jgi:hypothetical protein
LNGRYFLVDDLFEGDLIKSIVDEFVDVHFIILRQQKNVTPCFILCYD